MALTQQIMHVTRLSIIFNFQLLKRQSICLCLEGQSWVLSIPEVPGHGHEDLHAPNRNERRKNERKWEMMAIL